MKITNDQAFQVAMAIHDNEGRTAAELTDTQVGMYLVDRGIEESASNIAKVKKA